MLPTVCPHCLSRLEVDASCEGRPVLCGLCRETFTAHRDRPVARRRTSWDDDPPPRPGRPSSWEDEDEREPSRRRRSRGPNEGAIFSLVLGIVSVCIFCLWPAGMVTSAIGMVLGARALGTRSRPTAVSGLVLSTVGMIFAVGFAVVTVAAVAKVGLDDALGSVRTQPTLKNRR